RDAQHVVDVGAGCEILIDLERAAERRRRLARALRRRRYDPAIRRQPRVEPRRHALGIATPEWRQPSREVGRAVLGIAMAPEKEVHLGRLTAPWPTFLPVAQRGAEHRLELVAADVDRRVLDHAVLRLGAGGERLEVAFA